MYELKGRKVIITGGATGIGRSVALRMGREGCDVGLFDVDGVGAEATAAQVRDLGCKAFTATGDVGDKVSVETGTKALVEALGGVDVLVNNAGILRMGQLLDMGDKDWADTWRINVDGVFHCTRAVVPHMVAQGHGNVVNMSSWMGKKGVASFGAYCASKFAVIALTQSLAHELAGKGIRVNSVCPGLIVDTKMREEAEEDLARRGLPLANQRLHTIPLGRTGLPDDIARVVAFLASDEAAYMTGQAINVTGGLWMN